MTCTMYVVIIDLHMIFMIEKLITLQLFPGMSFGDLYQRCGEAFLVNSDLTLRAQLTEFRDHKLVKSKKVNIYLFNNTQNTFNRAYLRDNYHI